MGGGINNLMNNKKFIFPHNIQMTVGPHSSTSSRHLEKKILWNNFAKVPSNTWDNSNPSLKHFHAMKALVGVNSFSGIDHNCSCMRKSSCARRRNRAQSLSIQPRRPEVLNAVGNKLWNESPILSSSSMKL